MPGLLSQSPLPVSRKTLLLSATVAALVIAMAWQRGAEPAASATTRVQDMPSRHSPSLLPVAAVERRPSPVSVAARGTLATLVREFEDTPDMYGLAQRLTARERAGDPEALWIVSRIYDYCAAYAADPAGYARDTRTIASLRLAAGASMLAARERVSERCVRFAPTDSLSLQRINDKRQQAAEAGNLAAEAALLAVGRPLIDSEEYIRQLIERVLKSRDPEAYAAISPAMGLPSSGQEAYFGDISGTPLTELAWLVAACQLGHECGPDGALMTTYCAAGGICSKDESQDFDAFVRDAGVSRQSVEDLDVMVDDLLYGTGVMK